MKIFLFLFSLISMINPSPLGKVNSVWARSYIVMEANDGHILQGKDIHLSRSVASISKIMTAIIALESDKLFNVVTVGDEIKNAVGSSLYLEKGNQITIIDLVYGLLLRSGNDAANIIARNVASGIDDFVRLMNDKARELNMKDSTFNNPSGLDMYDEGNISSAHDMALLMRYCLSNIWFREIAGTKKYVSPLKGLWANKHKLIQSYEYCTGGKTGYTKKAKRTLVTSARKDDLELIVVTIDCGGDFSFHKSLFEGYFGGFTYLVFLDIGKNYIGGYEIVSLKRIGIMLEKEKVKGSRMLYTIDPATLNLTMSLVLKNNEVILVGQTTISSYSKSN